MSIISTNFWIVGTLKKVPIPIVFLPDITSTQNLKPVITSGCDLKPASESAIAPAPIPPPPALVPEITATPDLKPTEPTTRDLKPIIKTNED